MTIQYLGAKRIQGVAGDTKPTNVPNGTIFEETDTKKIYWHQGAGGFPKFIDNFNQYETQASADASWVSTDTGVIRVNITNNDVTQTIASDNTNNSIYADIGSAISNTAFIFRFWAKLDSGNSGQFPIFGLSSSNAGAGTTQDFIVCYIGNGAGTNIWTEHGDGVDLLSGTQADSGINVGNNLRYYQFARTSSTNVTIKVYSDPAYTIQVGSTQTLTVASTLQSLRYIVIAERLINNASVGTIHYGGFHVWDGVTSL